MKRCISNIAWDREEDDAAHALLMERGVRDLEIAPTRIWDDVEAATLDDARAWKTHLSRYGLRTTAYQALLFGLPNARIFRSPEEESACAGRVRHLADLAGAQGGGVFVFGSPKNRSRGDIPQEEAFQRARLFLRALGEYGFPRGVILGIEAIPEAYGCDFIRTVGEAVSLVRAVDHPGVRLHLDTGGLIVNEENPEEGLPPVMDQVCHVHISEPLLRNFDRPSEVHPRIAAVLQAGGYSGRVSIEMKRDPSGLDAVKKALDFVEGVYL